ncbi:hypothetical protein ACJJIW_07355 [Microbulbifer sp. JMSA004]|uniref:hypothetical protein n=1 Tax=unclassified Microbulbifer TaxID=2619833 RepID=UPI0024AE8471|nr:hypothetical protein [Microbulbifer sp. VAAF005]WHI45090.1 hypothetical protein P0078_15265 [Microbulbifer sp. VAAF005]
MNEADTEKQWLELESIWKGQQTSAEIPTTVLNWVRRQERRMRLAVAFEYLLAIAGAIYLLGVILAKNYPDTMYRVAFAIATLVLAIVFSIVNRRGLWAPLEESAKAYVELGLLRLRRKRREVYFSWLFLVLQIFIISMWELSRFLRGGVEPLVRNPQEALIVLSGLVVALALYSFYIYRRTEKEERVLTSFQENL